MDQYLLDLAMKFLELLVVALAPVLLGYAIAWVKKKTSQLQAEMDAHLSDRQRWLVEATVETAVKAAEQMKLAKFIEDKKEFAIEYIQGVLDVNNIHLDLRVIEAAIEAAVLDLNGHE